MPYVPPGMGMPYQPAGPYPAMPAPGMPPDQTGQLPMMAPPGVPPVQPAAGMPPPVPGYPPAQFPPAQLQSLEGGEFAELSRPEPSHWRGDLKWIFGILTTLMLFLTLAAAGAYRATNPGAAKDVLAPLIENATEVEQAVKDNYQQLRSRARRIKNGSVVIPDIDVSVSVKASQVNSMSSEELADVVVLEVERQVYSDGYSGLPMEAARGTGEERAKAVSATLIAEINKQNHESLLWVLIIAGVLTLAFAVLFVVFCRGWGRVVGLAVVVISASLPASLAIRFGGEFIWKTGTGGLYKSAAYQAFRSMGSLGVVFFDAALALGALLLLVGVIGGIISRRSRQRVPPFVDLQQPEEAVAGGQGLGVGQEESGEVRRDDEVALEAFRDLAPPPE